MTGTASPAPQPYPTNPLLPSPSTTRGHPGYPTTPPATPTPHTSTTVTPTLPTTSGPAHLDVIVGSGLFLVLAGLAVVVGRSSPAMRRRYSYRGVHHSTSRQPL